VVNGKLPGAEGASDLRVFALNDSAALGARVCGALGIAPSAHEEREFDDGEHKARALVCVRGCDVYVVQSLHGDSVHGAAEKLCRLLFFIGALRDAGASRITAVVPYLAYARKDRRTQPGDPVTTRYVAALFEAVGTDVVMAVDVHNVAAFHNAFRCRTEHIEPQRLFVAQLAPLAAGRKVVVVAPDAGASHRAYALRTALADAIGATVGSAFAEKHRSAGQLSGDLLVGDVKDCDVLIVDDLIATGATLARTAAACRRLGACRVTAVATHGLFTGDAAAVLSAAAIDKVIVTDTVPPFRLTSAALGERLTVLGVAPLLAAAIGLAREGEQPSSAAQART
jgi:ribose-phosphate pyrophosphokinase